MKCPSCGEISNGVVNSRPSSDRQTIMRRRVCTCGFRFSTREFKIQEEDCYKPGRFYRQHDDGSLHGTMQDSPLPPAHYAILLAAEQLAHAIAEMYAVKTGGVE